jgi:UDP-N-acetylglucosamine--N-acetylmuramyl-(pentapeptide) pyrophosphoryl-undecaprenol N-acetylglucosamine transferase
MARRVSILPENQAPLRNKASARIVFAGGGTAGHVFPGLAVAQELGLPILWIGSTHGVEKRILREAGIEFRGIPAGKLRRYLSLRNLSDVLKTIAGIAASVRLLRRERPALLFSKGGFVSVPPVVAAWLCGIPSWTHESDFDPGLATRINLRFSERVLVSFPETLECLPARYRGKAIVTGNPVRPSLYRADPRRGCRFVGCPDGVPLLLVLGGSLASAAVSRLVAGCLPDLRAVCFVVHQTGSVQGEGQPQTHEHPPAPPGDHYLPIPFIGAELADVMAAADLVVSRAGANTLSELAVLGKASVLIPLPRSVSRGDQLRNAEVCRAAGASVVLREEVTTPQSLASTVRSLLADGERLRRMRDAARSLGSERPAAAIAKLILERLG